jgi:hypothetical protein
VLLVLEARWFCRSTKEWNAFAERLKLMPCPHCKVVGALNRHGSLYGFDDSSSRHKTQRARRIFCNNRRQARPGCGRTFTLWHADKIRRLGLTSACLLRFLLLAATTSLRAASRSVNCHLTDRTMQRIWKRFDLGQTNIRVALLARCPLPPLPTQPTRRPAAAQVLAHLQTAFPDADPIAAYQYATRSFFV